jgi:hypothetical protein
MSFSQPKSVIAAVNEAMLSNKDIIGQLDAALAARKIEVLRRSALILLYKEVSKRKKRERTDILRGVNPLAGIGPSTKQGRTWVY